MPSVIAITGFLGDSADFGPMIASCPSDWSWHVVTPLDLGGRGIAEMAEALARIPADLRIGYSMGGRILLAALDGTPSIALSTGCGLTEKKAMHARATLDDQRANHLRNDPKIFLDQWYEQPLFATLRSSPVWGELEVRRQGACQQANRWAGLLQAASPGRTAAPVLRSPLGFVVGDLDRAYRIPPEPFPNRVLPETGHAVHLESPESTARAINELLKDLEP